MGRYWWRGVLLLLVAVGCVGADDGCDHDEDGDGFVSSKDCDDDTSKDAAVCETSTCDGCDTGLSVPAECYHCARCTHPDIRVEFPDIKDNQCDGFADEPPVGLELDGERLKGVSTAVLRVEDTIYLAAMGTVVIFHDNGTDPPVQVNQGAEIVTEDGINRMAYQDGILFLAAQNAGLEAFDVSDPTAPRPAGTVKGIVARYVDARAGRVAVGMRNSLEVRVYDYDPSRTGEEFQEVFRYLDDGNYCVTDTSTTDVSAVALTSDGRSLFVGYDTYSPLPSLQHYDGELALVQNLDGTPATACLPHEESYPNRVIGTVGEIVPVENGEIRGALVTTHTSFDTYDAPSLRWVWLEGDRLASVALVGEPGKKGVGYALDGDLDAVGFCSSYQIGTDNDNVWLVTNPLDDARRQVFGGRTVDIAYDVDLHWEGGTPVLEAADEWGGYQVYRPDSGSGRLVRNQKIDIGGFGAALWVDGDGVFAGKEGAGLWGYSATADDPERLVLEYIHPDDPGCRSPGACPEVPCPGEDLPSVFVRDGTTRGAYHYVITSDRSDLVGWDRNYFMIVRDDGADARVVFSDPIGYAATYMGLSRVLVEDDLVFVTYGESGIHVYQHCPGSDPEARLLASWTDAHNDTPIQYLDLVRFGDYLLAPAGYVFLFDFQNLWKSLGITVFQLRGVDATTDCTSGAQVDLEPVATLPANVAGAAWDPYRIAWDRGRNLLFAAGTELVGYAWPEPGAELTQDLLDDLTPVLLTPAEDLQRVGLPAMYGLAILNDHLFVADVTNGIYGYDIGDGNPAGTLDLFYPTFDSLSARPIPVEADVRPVHSPRGLAVAPNGDLLVLEWFSGRVSRLVAR